MWQYASMLRMEKFGDTLPNQPRRSTLGRQRRDRGLSPLALTQES